MDDEANLTRMGRAIVRRGTRMRILLAQSVTATGRTLAQIWAIRMAMMVLRIGRQTTVAQRAQSLVDPLRKRVDTLVNANLSLRERLLNIAAQNREAAVPPVRAHIADSILSYNIVNSISWKPTHIVAHDLNTVPTGTFLARYYGAHLTVDAVESLEFAERTGGYYHQHFTGIQGQFLEATIAGLLKNADAVTTISPYFVDYFKKRGCDDVRFLPNYRDVDKGHSKRVAKRRSALAPVSDGELIVAIPNAFDDPAPILAFAEAASKRGLRLSFRQMGLAPTESIRSELNAAFDRSSEHSIRYLGVKPHADFLNEMSSCHFAVSLFEATTNNIVNAFPNRLFDCIASGTPLLVSGMEYTGNYLVENGFGAIARSNGVADLDRALEPFLSAVEQMSQTIQTQQSELSWTHQSDTVFDYIAPGAKVLVVGKKKLDGHVRVNRIAETLTRRGAYCEIVGVDHEGPVQRRNIHGLPLFNRVEGE